MGGTVPDAQDEERRQGPLLKLQATYQTQPLKTRALVDVSVALHKDLLLCPVLCPSLAQRVHAMLVFLASGVAT